MDNINIIEPDNSFDFDKLTLGTLTNVVGGSYFSRLYFNNKPLYIQPPKSLTKQGIIKSGKKQYCDLMFTNQDELFIHWIENLETSCQKLLYNKNTEWFSAENKIEMHDIENSFTSPVKIFKSGRFYLVRTNIKPNIKIYNNDSIIPCENITNETCMVSVVEVQGIKFTSKTFQIELEIKQCLVVSVDPFLDNCLIKTSNSKTSNSSSSSSSLVKPELPMPTVNVSNIVAQSSNNEPLMAAIILKDLKDLKEENIGNENIEQSYENNMDDDEIFNMLETPVVSTGALSNLEITPPQKVAVKHDAAPLTAPLPLHKETKKNTLINSQTTITPASLTSISNIKIGDDIPDLPEVDIDFQDLTEVDFTADNSLETITLKKPNQVYYEIYNEARKKAKECKKEAILAYLKAKNIKKTYMLEDDSESDSDGSDYSESDLEDFEQGEN
jgi:hypothetical protein